MPKKDHLSNEVSLEASLSGTGVSGKVKSRALAALDRFAGSLIDIPTAKLEAAAARIRAESNQKIRLLTSANESIHTLEDEEKLAQAVVKINTAERIEPTINKLHVAKLAIKHLSNNQSNEKRSSGNDNLEEDWLNYFEQYAEKATSEKMRDLWARVLAGEIRKPQSFSLATLRFLSELDQEIAKVFERETMHRMQNGFILMPEDQEKRNQRFFDLSFLEEVGLLQDVTLGAQVTKKLNDEGYFIWREGNLMLKAKAEESIRLEVVRITRVGQEITHILPPPSHMEVLEKIAERIFQNVQSLEIIEVIKEDSAGTGWLRTIKTLKEENS